MLCLGSSDCYVQPIGHLPACLVSLGVVVVPAAGGGVHGSLPARGTLALDILVTLQGSLQHLSRHLAKRKVQSEWGFD